MGKRQSYSEGIDLVEEGFIACWKNIQDLVSSARILFDNEKHAPALSLAVLALEEMGKLISIDGLLLSVQGDDKSNTYRKSSRSHKDKLIGFEVFALLLHSIAQHDARIKNDDLFKRAFLIGIINMKDAGNAVLSLLGPIENFTRLDQEKQSGFYSALYDGKIAAPREHVSKELAKAVLVLAEIASGNLSFVLSDGGLSKYISFFRDVRRKLSAQGHEQVKAMADMAVREIFDTESVSTLKPN